MQMQEVAGERGGYLHGRGGNFSFLTSMNPLHVWLTCKIGNYLLLASDKRECFTYVAGC